MATTAIEKFNFDGDALDVHLEEGGSVWISVRSVCNALGLDRKRQQQKLQASPWATGGMKPLVAEERSKASRSGWWT